MKDMQKTKFEIVKKYVDEMDYMDLLSLGCPKNEYDGESEKIASDIRFDMSVEEIASIIDNVFVNSFFTGIDISNPSDPKEVRIDGGEEYNDITSPKLLKAANSIYNELLKFK